MGTQPCVRLSSLLAWGVREYLSLERRATQRGHVWGSQCGLQLQPFALTLVSGIGVAGNSGLSSLSPLNPKLLPPKKTKPEMH